MEHNSKQAPGRPGQTPTWTSASKDGVGTSLNPTSQVHFTLGHGIVNEVYFPRLDQACLRHMELIVTGPGGFYSEEKRDTRHDISMVKPGVPLYQIVNTCKADRYRIEKDVFTSTRCDTLLMHVCFAPQRDTLDDYRLFVSCNPHLGNHGEDNTAWVGAYKGVPMLCAIREANALALACSAPWRARSAGYVGASDGRSDLRRHGELTETYARAEEGNVVLVGEVDLTACDGRFVLALGFGGAPEEAAFAARAGTQRSCFPSRDLYVSEWEGFQSGLRAPEELDSRLEEAYRTSAAVIRVHEAAHFPGGIIASLSIPWGFGTGRHDLGGYHLVWPRDQIQAAGGLLACGSHDDACRALDYLEVIQEDDGHWTQNAWLSGRPYWKGVQMDEAALPILLVDLAHREQAMGEEVYAGFWPMVRKAAEYLLRNGPATPQERWEEVAGYSVSTLAVEVAALLTASVMAEHVGETDLMHRLRDTADGWNEHIEEWTYVTDTALCDEVGVDGYYARVAAVERQALATIRDQTHPVPDRMPRSLDDWRNVVSPDVLNLVRFGLRRPDDPRILNTIKVVDAKLKLDTPYGPVWHRYNGDHYGEYPDGSRFDGDGVGRAWPLLTGERGHYELAAGCRGQALCMLQSMERFAGATHLIPEQVWDADDLPEKELFFGRPTGSAMPLVWAHAEYLKLYRSIADGRVFDMPPYTSKRYLTP